MKTDHWEKAKEIFGEALKLAPDERLRFLDEVCADDSDTRREVESLLSSLDTAESFLETPAAGEVANVVKAETNKLESGKCFGHYEIVKMLGAGGMGEVYLAKDKKLDRKVAIKILNEKVSQHESNLQRFTQEAKAASALNHPNIMVIHEIGESEEANYIVSEFIEGKTLREIVGESSMKLSEVLDITIQVANALTAAHTASIVHRDIKPENVMIRPDGYVKILDFGLAKLIKQKQSFIGLEDATVKQNETAQGVIMGTVSYMSPEQAKAEKVDERTDIFSLGIMIYEMLTGRTPFAGNSMSETFANLINTEPQPLSRFAQNVPDEMQRIVAKTLRKHKDERYQTMKGLLADLRNLHDTLRFEGKFGKPYSYDTENPTEKLVREIDTNIEPKNNFQTEAIRSLAILPFRNLTQDSSVSFFEFSLADAVTTELARLRSLIVRPSSVIAKYQNKEIDAREAGREMRVNSVLSAAFIHSGTRLRVTAQLLDVSTGAIIWSDRIDSDASDVFALQDAITQRILDGLKFDLTTDEKERFGQRPTNNNEAYEEYLRGRDKFARFIFRTLSPADCNAAIESFKRAVELDPKFALAWSGLGACYANKVFKAFGDLEDYNRAEAAFKIALGIDPNISEARVLMCFIHLSRGEKQKARAELTRLYEHLPNEAPTYFLKAVMHRLDGEYDEALKSWDRFEKLDPSSTGVVCWNRARLYALQGDYERALQELDCGEVIEPNQPFIKLYRGQILFYKGEVEKAARIMKSVLAENPHLEGLRPLFAIILAAQNKPKEARKNLSQSVLKKASADHDISYWTASAYALLGEKDAAFEWLERAVKLGIGDLNWLEKDKSLDSLRDDKRFAQLIEHISNEQGRKLKLDEAIKLCQDEDTHRTGVFSEAVTSPTLILNQNSDSEQPFANNASEAQTTILSPVTATVNEFGVSSSGSNLNNQTISSEGGIEPTKGRTQNINRGYIIALFVFVLAIGSFGFWLYSSRSPNTKQITSIAVDAPKSAPKLYRQMAEAEQLGFIRERARHVQTLIGDEPTDFDEEALRAIKVEIDDYVEDKDSLSQKPFEEGLRVIYGRASQYAPIVIRAYEARQVPPALGLYQAMVESEYRDCWVSQIGSVGLFQFKPSTAQEYGLTPKDYCNVEKQSDAAASYMTNLISDFGEGKSSWTLALFSFNQGENRVRDYLRQLRGRGITERSFWAVFRYQQNLQTPLTDEGKEYVPRFFAVAIIGETPIAFELSTPPLTTLATKPD